MAVIPLGISNAPDTWIGFRRLETMTNRENEQQQTVVGLLFGYARILAELRDRGVVRSNNAPAGDYAEWLCASALDATLVDNFSVKSYDLALSGS